MSDRCAMQMWERWSDICAQDNRNLRKASEIMSRSKAWKGMSEQRKKQQNIKRRWDGSAS